MFDKVPRTILPFASILSLHRFRYAVHARPPPRARNLENIHHQPQETRNDLVSPRNRSRSIVASGKRLRSLDRESRRIEPAIFAKTILTGPAMDNFRVVTEIFARQDALIQVTDGEDFKQRLLELARDPEQRQRYGDAARATVEANRGAIAKTLELLRQLEDSQ